MRGIPSFFTPNLARAARHAVPSSASSRRRTTAPRRCATTLHELVDWQYLCDCRTRLTVGAVNACSGAMRYFDTREETLGVEHVMASGALPPAFGAVRIDGEPYWDGGIYSNTPIEAVLDDKPRRDSLIFAVNVWHQTATEPSSIWEVMARTQGHPVREPRRQPHRAPEADPPPAPRHPRADQAGSRRRAGRREGQGARVVGLRHADARRPPARAAPRQRGPHQGHRLHAERHPRCGARPATPTRCG